MSPLQVQPRDRLLFIGDSITHAFRKPEEAGSSYRLGAGWVMMLAAQFHAEHSELALEVENRGECGHTLTDLAKRWDADCLAWQPTVLSLLAGVNDTQRTFKYGTGLSHGEFHEVYRGLLAQTRQALPAVRLILCEPFLLEVGTVTAAWRDDLRHRQRIVRELATEFGAVFVELQAAFDRSAERTGPAYWLFDGIHPHAAGQWLIRTEWRRQVLGSDAVVERTRAHGGAIRQRAVDPSLPRASLRVPTASATGSRPLPTDIRGNAGELRRRGATPQTRA